MPPISYLNKWGIKGIGMEHGTVPAELVQVRILKTTVVPRRRLYCRMVPIHRHLFTKSHARPPPPATDQADDQLPRTDAFFVRVVRQLRLATDTSVVETAASGLRTRARRIALVFLSCYCLLFVLLTVLQPQRLRWKPNE